MRGMWWGPSIVVLVLAASGPLLAYVGRVSPEAGFRLFFVGVILAALAAMALAGAAAVASALGRAWRGAALRAAVLPLLVALVAMASTTGRERWPYNDVTTDLANPPAFVAGPAAGADYPRGFESAQREYFPDLEGIVVPVPPREALRRVVETARTMPDWTEVRVREPDGVVQAVAVSRIFRFRDDIVVRVRPDGGGSRVDVRSRSRVGRSDLGANAERIRAFLSRLRGS